MSAKNAKNSWYRAYHGMVSDDKWPLIARKSGQSVAAVVAVWCALLDCASQAQDRGCVADFDPESWDAMLGLDDGACEAILDVLRNGKFPRIKDDRIVSWDKRQPKREREDTGSSTGRVRDFRGRQKSLVDGVSADETPCNTNETPQSDDETPCNAQRRGEEIRGEKNLTVGGNSTVGYGPQGDVPPPPDDGKKYHAWVAGSAGVLNKGLFVAWLDRAHAVRPVWLKSRMNQLEREAAVEAFRCCGGFSDGDWKLLEAFYKAKLPKDRNGKELFWRPTGRKRFFEDLGDIIGDAERWAKETGWRASVRKPKPVTRVAQGPAEPLMSDEELLAEMNETRKELGKPVLTMEEFYRGDFLKEDNWVSNIGGPTVSNKTVGR